MNDFSDLVLTFTSEELSEHDKQIRADAIDGFVKVIDSRIDTLIEKEWLHSVAEKLKERK